MIQFKIDSTALTASIKEYKMALSLAFVKTVQGTIGELLNVILQANPVGDSMKYQSFYLQRQQYSGYAPREGLSSGSWIVEYDKVTPDREVSYGGREASKQRFDLGKSEFKLGDTIYLHNSVDYITRKAADSDPGFLGDIQGEKFVMQAVRSSYAVAQKYLTQNNLM